MKAYLFLISLSLLANIGYTQYISIHGKVTNKKTGDELINTHIDIYKKEVFVVGDLTDSEGNYQAALDPGTYTINVSHPQYESIKINEIIVAPGKVLKLDIQLSHPPRITCYLLNYPYTPKPIYEDKDIFTKNSKNIRNASTKNINELLLHTPGVSIIRF